MLKLASDATIIETERLRLRRFVETDVDAINRLRADADFMRHLGNAESRDETASWLRYVSGFWQYNAGFWAVVSKETNQTIGWSGTWSLLEFDIGTVEIGYAVGREFWGGGLATEAAQAALAFAFEVRRAEAVCAVAAPENAASLRVMQKLGMRFGGKRFFPAYNREMVFHRIARAEYNRK